MTKVFKVMQQTSGNLGTAMTWYKQTDIELLNNTSQSPIRVDKCMVQLSAYTDAAQPAVLMFLVHLTDETGASLTGSVSNGVTTDTNMTTLLNQWKDLVFMTDVRIIGVGNDETNVFVGNLEADTRRILQPGQKLIVTILCEPIATETNKHVIAYLDSIVWYSPAAQ